MLIIQMRLFAHCKNKPGFANNMIRAHLGDRLSLSMVERSEKLRDYKKQFIEEIEK